MTKSCALASLLLGAACRLGGPEGSPTELLEIDGALPAQPDAAGEPEEVDAPGDGDDPAPVEPAPDAPDAAAPSTPDAAPARCQAPSNLECDPVRGEGCLPLMQCVADPASSAPSAYCVFSGLLLDVACAQDELSTNCPPQYACMQGKCRKYCYCDADCENGAACAEPSAGSGAFRVCEGALP